MYNIKQMEKTLENGMKVVLIQKEGFKKSLFMCASPCGGFDIEQECNGKKIMHATGCAHFLEHQMFRYNHQDVTELFANMQAQTNAFTSYTETCYYFQTTADIYKPLALLLDFVQTLDIDEKSVQKEKGIILSEFDMYQQSPEQRLMKETYCSMYKNHPIHIDILGTRNDIETMDVEMLSKFYELNYDPSRLVLVGITSENVLDCMSFIEDYEKKYPSKISCIPVRVMEKEPENVLRKDFCEYMDVSIPYICLGYKFDGCNTIEEANFKDLMVQIRLDSLFSAMNPSFQSWLDQRILNQFYGAECDFSCDRGYILFYAQTTKEKEFIDVVDSIMDSLIDKKIREEDFEAISNSYIGQNLRGLDQFDGLAIDWIRSTIFHYDYWNWFDSIKFASPSMVYDSCHSLNKNHRTITRIYPKECKK
ncbi:EF-P 5-aminopentanol modification-associated protein YfmH [Floccifex sp.]|uniref:EF-P 5-aminopentanol modification-associated protein YfmH n=1 Tax=Floccifex sp. TaxID=2815810 RepID=UPI003F0D5C35